MRHRKVLVLGEGQDARAEFLAEHPEALVLQANPYANISGLADTVEDEIAYGVELTASNRDAMRQSVHEVSEKLGITYLLGKHPLGLSGGQTQLVALASIFTIKSTALFLENPLVGLDASARQRALALMEQYRGELMWSNPARVGEDERALATSIVEEVFEHAPADQQSIKWRLDPAALVAENLEVPVPSARWSKRTGQTLLSGVTLEVAPGESLALTGANGSGKSTLLKTLAGIAKPKSGRVRVGEQDVARTKTKRRPQLISLATQQPRYQILTTSVEREITAGTSDGKDYGHQLLQSFDLESSAAENPYDLSNSAQQLLAVACALASAPSVLALDEPSASLSPQDYQTLVGLLNSFTQAGGVLVVASHDEELIRDINARVFTLT
ncbi:ATP-binding cassette domain-containing protein [Rothia terrae]|uniref:ATP-binding cassette domain-containing protein n=1 Tax=Rothia terrae TaxID=396015 RepID=A0A7H2BCT4_9MICC|nr:ATP-binding cassette domain-containing protein [Rothia terrae]QNV37480.1 ATP-binding cassette domain-containing protein [Rothia terrae]